MHDLLDAVCSRTGNVERAVEARIARQTGSCVCCIVHCRARLPHRRNCRAAKATGGGAGRTAWVRRLGSTSAKPPSAKPCRPRTHTLSQQRLSWQQTWTVVVRCPPALTVTAAAAVTTAGRSVDSGRSGTATISTIPTIQSPTHHPHRIVSISRGRSCWEADNLRLHYRDDTFDCEPVDCTATQLRPVTGATELCTAPFSHYPLVASIQAPPPSTPALPRARLQTADDTLLSIAQTHSHSTPRRAANPSPTECRLTTTPTTPSSLDGGQRCESSNDGTAKHDGAERHEPDGRRWRHAAPAEWQCAAADLRKDHARTEERRRLEIYRRLAASALHTRSRESDNAAVSAPSSDPTLPSLHPSNLPASQLGQDTVVLLACASHRRSHPSTHSPLDPTFARPLFVCHVHSTTSCSPPRSCPHD